MPGQNAGVRTALLEPYRGDLGEWMRMPYLFFQLLRAKGARLFVEPAARSAHLNVTDRRAWLAERFGRGAHVRERPLGAVARIGAARLYAGSPAIPLLRAAARAARPAPWRRAAARGAAAARGLLASGAGRGGRLCGRQQRGPADDLRDRARS